MLMEPQPGFIYLAAADKGHPRKAHEREEFSRGFKVMQCLGKSMNFVLLSKHIRVSVWTQSTSTDASFLSRKCENLNIGVEFMAIML